MGWILLATVFILVIVGLSILKTKHGTKLERMRIKGKEQNYTPEQIEEILAAEKFPVPNWVTTALIALSVGFIGLGTFHKVFFYAEPGYVYHIKTAFNQERVIFTDTDGIGWSYYGFGGIEPWKRGMSIQAARNTGATLADQINETDDTSHSNAISANLLPQNIVFLDQVDADASAMARFRIPTDDVGFLKLAREYRTAENFLNTALVPAFKETLQATASLMSAEEYFSGSRTEFNTEFQAQLEGGIYIVKRKEILVEDLSQRNKGTANATKTTHQEEFGDGKKVIFKVIKMMADDNLTPLRKEQNYVGFGVSVIDARVTEMIPNPKFKERMDNKQKASADRAIAREKRIQEEEQKLLAIAEGERKVAERQAKALVEQIQATTDAETTKQLVITKATQQKEQAAIDKETSQIRLDQAIIDAKKIKELANANAYEREKLLESDNGLKVKTDAIVQMNADNATAFANRKVPHTVIYQNGAKGGLGSNDEIATIAQTQMLKNLKALDLDLGVKKGN
jgi:regulator of protease activity HflC (stomatin/prohibitin superfamily)